MKDRSGQGKGAARGREPATARLWSVMYPAHFRMTENPFTADADPKFLWLGGKRKEILADLVRGILDRGGVHVVMGASGTGKTQLANAVVDELGDRALAAVVPFAECKGIDFPKLVERAFGTGGDPQGQGSFADRFSEFLRRTVTSGRPAVLIVDDAHRLNGSALRELSQIAGLEENGTRLLQLVFFGENRFRDQVNDEANRGLFESVGVRLVLDPLSRDETAQYIRHRLRVTQCERELFTSDAVEEIFTYSKGIPSLVNRACEAALSRAFYLGEQLVPQDTVREALKLMPPEKTARTGTARDLPFEMVAASGPEGGEDTDEDDEPGIPAGEARKRGRGWVVYAALGGILVALVAVSFIVLKGKTPAVSPRVDVKQTATHPPVPSADRETAAPAVKAQSPGPPAVPPSVVSAVEQPGPGAEVRGERKKARQASVSRSSAEKTRRPAAKGPRREAAPSEGRAPAGDTGREPSADRVETAGQESASGKAEQVESGEVIDWMLKKRSGQK